MNAKQLASYSRWHRLRHTFWTLTAEVAFSRAVDAYQDAATTAERSDALTTKETPR